MIVARRRVALKNVRRFGEPSREPSDHAAVVDAVNERIGRASGMKNSLKEHQNVEDEAAHGRAVRQLAAEGDARNG